MIQTLLIYNKRPVLGCPFIISRSTSWDNIVTTQMACSEPPYLQICILFQFSLCNVHFFVENMRRLLVCYMLEAGIIFSNKIISVFINTNTKGGTMLPSWSYSSVWFEERSKCSFDRLYRCCSISFRWIFQLIS